MTEKRIHLTWLQPICFWKLPVYQQSQWTQAHLTRGFTLYIQQFRTSNFCTYLSLPTVCKLVVLHTHVDFSQIVWGAMTCPLLWDNYLHKNCCCNLPVFLKCAFLSWREQCWPIQSEYTKKYLSFSGFSYYTDSWFMNLLLSPKYTNKGGGDVHMQKHPARKSRKDRELVADFTESQNDLGWKGS